MTRKRRTKLARGYEWRGQNRAKLGRSIPSEFGMTLCPKFSFE